MDLIYVQVRSISNLWAGLSALEIQAFPETWGVAPGWYESGLQPFMLKTDRLKGGGIGPGGLS